MNPSDYTGCDIDKMQLIDNENYQNRYHNKSVKDYSSDVGKGPENIADLLKTKSSKEWIVDSFGARGSCVLLAGETGSGKTSFIYQMAYAISTGNIFLGELTTQNNKVLIIQSDESKNNALDKLELMDIDGSNSNLYFYFAEDGWERLNIKNLKEEVLNNSFKVVLLDSVTTLLTNNGRSMRDPEFATPLYELNKLASELNILIICTAHLRKPEGIRHEVGIHDVIGAITQSGAVSDIWGIWVPTKQSHKNHFILKCLGKRNCRKGIIWNLKGDEEDFSFVLKSVGEGELLPSKNQELSFLILDLLHTKNEFKTIREIASETSSNEEHTRRVCKNLFLEKEISRKRDISKGGRPPWKYGPKTFPTCGI